MKKIYNSVFVLLSIFVIISCEDIFESDLDGMKVLINTPDDAASIYEGNVVFWWNYIDLNENFNEKYNLIVVSPSFDAISQVVLDTSIASNRFEHEMTKGEYEFMVFAFNGSTFSDTTIQNFSVIDTTTSKILTHNTSVNFFW